MKKLFSSAISVAVAVACFTGSASFSAFADAIYTETGTCGGVEINLADSENYELKIDGLPEILSNYNEGAYNFGDFLDENNRAVYDAMSALTTPSLDVISVDLPDTISISLTGLPGSSSYTEEDEEAFSTAIFDACKAGMDSVLFDMPEIFWLDLSKVAIGVDNIDYTRSMSGKYNLKIETLTFTPGMYDALTTLDEALDYKQKLEEAVEKFPISGENRYEQLLGIHDTIALDTTYDLTAPFMSSAVGALVEDGAVCEGYSKGLKLLCDRLNIPCVLVFGNYDATENVAHMWNYVQMEDGNWYAIDLTWDDLDGDYGAEIKYQYFIKGSNSFFGNHTEETDYIGTILTYPELYAEDYELTSTEPVETTTATETETTTEETTTTTEATTSTAKPVTTEETTTTTEATTSTAKPATTEETTTTTEATTSTAKPVTTEETTTTTEVTTSTEKPATTEETTTTTEATTSTAKPATTEETTTTAKATTTTEVQTEAPTETTTEAQEYEQGDFNKDGEVNVADLVLCAKAILGIESDYVCDYDGDGIVDFVDMILIRKAVLPKYIR